MQSRFAQVGIGYVQNSDEILWLVKHEDIIFISKFGRNFGNNWWCFHAYTKIFPSQFYTCPTLYSNASNWSLICEKEAERLLYWEVSSHIKLQSNICLNEGPVAPPPLTALVPTSTLVSVQEWSVVVPVPLSCLWTQRGEINGRHSYWFFYPPWYL